MDATIVAIDVLSDPERSSELEPDGEVAEAFPGMLISVVLSNYSPEHADRIVRH